jgi:protein-tyrosine phosphatase
VFQHQVNEKGLSKQILVDSAGTAAWHVGKSPDPRSIKTAAKNGYDLTSLRARQAIAEDFKHYNYIVAMDNSNLFDLQDLRPSSYQGELALLLSYNDSYNSSGTQEVPDPYYGDGDGFQHVVELVEHASRALLDKIIKQHELKV